jgi:hypothetical protein
MKTSLMYLLEQPMKVTMGGRWSYHKINEYRSYSRWYKKKILVCWPKVDIIKILCGNTIGV